MALVLDIETIPQAPQILAEKMPEALKNPVMPPELVQPDEPDWSAKAPEYSIPEIAHKARAAEQAYKDALGLPRIASLPDDADEKAKAAHAKATAERAKAEEALLAKRNASAEKLREAQSKREKWIEENRGKWSSKLRDDRAKWELGVMEGKAKFVREAALDARLGHAKLLGLRDTLRNTTQIFIWEPDKATIQKVRNWFAALPLVTEGGKARKYRDTSLVLMEFREEKAMVSAFIAGLKEAMDPMGEPGDVEEMPRGWRREQAIRPDLVTYFGNTFDLPFMFRRAWVLGLPVAVPFRRGRYWEERIIDLHELWQFGDRQETVGGLDGLSAALGYKGAKLNDGQTFGEWYYRDPVEGVVYLINDLDLTQENGVKMGVIHPPRMAGED